MSGRRRNQPEHAAPPTPPAPGRFAEPADAELAGWLVDADETALSELYQRFGRPCYALARRICADDGLAEDVVHEVFQTLWRDPHRFDPARGGFATWLLTLIHRTAVDAVRRQSAPRRQDVAPEMGDGWRPAPETDLDQTAMTRPAAGQVRAALGQLPGEQRQVLAGAYFGGYTQREIAAFTGVPLTVVQSRMFAGVRRLQEVLAGQIGPDLLVAETRAVGKVSP